MVNSIEVIECDSPFYIEELPLGNKVYVFDNYLSAELHHHTDSFLRNQTNWQKNNCVQSVDNRKRGGLPSHELWGASYFRSNNGQKIKCRSHHNYPYYMDFLDKKICTDFSFEWIRFQYMGTNSQTSNQNGSCHSDCSPDDDFNLSFLYYTNTFWNDNWGGDLRFYSQHVETGTEEHMDDYEIGRVAFKPNRLLMFDGRISHGAEAPSTKANYIDRRSIVLRGDEVRLLDKQERYANN